MRARPKLADTMEDAPEAMPRGANVADSRSRPRPYAITSPKENRFPVHNVMPRLTSRGGAPSIMNVVVVHPWERSRVPFVAILS